MGELLQSGRGDPWGRPNILTLQHAGDHKGRPYRSVFNIVATKSDSNALLVRLKFDENLNNG